MNLKLKRISTTLAIIFAGFFGGCDTTTVLLPVPTTLYMVFNLDAGSNTFNETVGISGNQIAQDILDQLDDDITSDDIDRYNVESVSFRVLSADNPSTGVSGSVNVSTGGTAVQLFSLNVAQLSDAIDEDVTPTLNDAAVQLLENALKSIFEGNNNVTIIGNINGQFNPSSTDMVLQVALTVAPVVKQEVEIFDPI